MSDSRDRLVGQGRAVEVYYRSDSFLNDLDLRFRPGQQLRRRYRALIAAIGGLDAASPQQDSVIRRIVHLEALLEETELARLSNKPPVLEVGAYLQAINTLTGLFRLLGLKRMAKPIPSLQEYLHARAEEKSAPQDAQPDSEESTDAQ